MCNKRIEGSGKVGVVIWTATAPFAKDKPGFVARSTSPGMEGEVHFSDNIWDAAVYERGKEGAALQLLRRRTPKDLFTHEAVAQLVVPV